MKKRDPLMTNEYFSNEVKYEIETLAKFENQIIISKAANPSDVASFLYSIFRKHNELFSLRYSQGENLPSLIPSFNTLIVVFERYVSSPFCESSSFTSEVDDYASFLWLLSLAMLLKTDDEELKRLLNCIGNEGEDALFEVMVATRLGGRRVASKLVYPKIYSKLLLAAQGVEPVKNMKQFLAGWYKSMKDCYWHDNHKGPEGGGYFGYWCWEAAAVSVAFNIDDTEFRNMPYYPKDMADYSRALK